MSRISPTWLFAVSLVGLTFVMVPATLRDSATVDEPDHLMAGLVYWKTGAFSVGCDHPPLARMWMALPVQFIQPHLAPLLETAQMRELYQAGVDTLYRNDNPTRRMLLWGRLSNWGLVCLCAAIIYGFSSSLFGSGAGLVSSLAFLLNPGVLAHGRLITTDMAGCLGYLIGTWSLARAYRDPTLRNFGIAAFLLAVGFCMKFNTVPLLGVLAFVVMSATGKFRGQALDCFNRFSKIGFVSLCALLFSIWAIYLFQTGPLISALGSFLEEIDRDLETVAQRIPFGLGGSVQWLIESVPVPAPAFWTGLGIVTSIKREAFLMGGHSLEGWFYYLPVAFVLKTPVPLLLLYFIGFGFAVAGWKKHPHRKVLTILFLAMGLYWLTGCIAKWSIGYRHLLPVIPLNAVLVGSLIWSRPDEETRKVRLNSRTAATAVMLLLTSFSLISQYPRYLSYFNILCGGSQNGYRYLIDSNLDWGQDVLRLKRFCEDRGIEKAVGEIFCPDNLEYHGLEISAPSSFEDFKYRIADGEYGFVSANFLMGIHEEARVFWKSLEAIPPTDRIGDSIFVYGGPD